jgi:hypothetical protein
MDQGKSQKTMINFCRRRGAMSRRQNFAALALAVTFGLALGAGGSLARTGQGIHPHMFQADRLLGDALNELRAAGSDYGEHRLRAVEHVKAAMEEINAGLAGGGMLQRHDRHSCD